MILFKECLKHGLTPFIIESPYEWDYGQILTLGEQEGVEELSKFWRKSRTSIPVF